MLNTPGGRERLEALGVRTVPVVARGDDYVFAQSLRDVVAFLGLDEEVGPALEPAELVDRMDHLLEAAQRFVRQMPDELLDHLVVPNRPRSYRVLLHHVFQIPVAFLDAARDGGTLVYDRLVEAPPDDMRTGEDIARFGGEVRRQIMDWWLAEEDTSATRPVSTYFGEQALHDVLERTTWHSGQHVRQIMALLERHGIQPDRPLGPTDFEGLPVPEKVWD